MDWIFTEIHSKHETIEIRKIILKKELLTCRNTEKLPATN